MHRLYTIAYTLLLWLKMPLGLLHVGREGERRAGFAQRMGRFGAKTKQALTNRQMLWLHANHPKAQDLAASLVAALEPRIPLLKIVISTHRNESMGRLRKRFPSHIEKFFSPFDLPRPVQRTVNVMHPEAVVLLEPDLQPNLLRRLRQRGTPVILADATSLSRSRRRYRWLPFFYRPIFGAFDSVLTQTELEATRMQKMGCRTETLEVVGTWPTERIKLRERRQLDVADLLRRIGVPKPAKILLGDHLDPGEERLLAGVYAKLKPQHPNLFLILIPDRYQRGKEVGRELKKTGLHYVYRTAVTAVMQMEEGSTDALLVNTRGESVQFCEHADVVVIGSTLLAPGKENLTEAASLGKPMVVGPYIHDDSPLTRSLLSQGGACQADNQADLEQVVDALLGDAERRAAMGRQALETSASHRGAVEGVIDAILRELDPEILGKHSRS